MVQEILIQIRKGREQEARSMIKQWVPRISYAQYNELASMLYRQTWLRKALRQKTRIFWHWQDNMRRKDLEEQCSAPQGLRHSPRDR